MEKNSLSALTRVQGILTVLLSAAAIIVITSVVVHNRTQGTPPPTGAGAAAPDIVVVAEQGERIHLSDYRGRAVLVHFWASWCGPCVKELPIINNAARLAAEGDSAAILAINVGESRGTIREFTMEHEIDMPIHVDVTGTAADAFRIKGLPASILISPEGKIVRIEQGPFQSFAELERSLQDAQ